jgi:hypothetical protein
MAQGGGNMPTTEITLDMNEIHKPSVSFTENEADAFLAETFLSGKLYVTKSWLRANKYAQGDTLKITAEVVKSA